MQSINNQREMRIEAIRMSAAACTFLKNYSSLCGGLTGRRTKKLRMRFIGMVGKKFSQNQGVRIQWGGGRPERRKILVVEVGYASYHERGKEGPD